MQQHYQSPVRLFEHLNIQENEIFSEDLPRLKKRLKAEFVLSDTGVLEIDTFSYNLNDILKEVETNDFKQRLAFHYLLWKDEKWRNILEKDMADLQEIDDINRWKTNDNFCEFVSPFFAMPFNHIMKILLSENRFYDGSIWLSTKAYILAQEEEAAYESLRRYLEEALFLFRNVNKDNYKNKIEEIKVWGNKNWSTLINWLPDYLFYYKDAMANGLINLSVTLQYSEKELCYQISSELLKLEGLSNNISVLIKKNHKIFKENKGKKFSFLWGIGAFILFKVLSGSDSCKSHDSSLNYYDNQMKKGMMTKQHIDSLPFQK